MTDTLISIVGTTMVPIGDLKPYARNPRAGDIDAIADSIRTHGMFRHLVVNRRDNTVLAGNHLLHAAHDVGVTAVPVAYVDVDDKEAARIVLVDNRTSDLGGYDQGLPLNLLDDLRATDVALDGTGYSQQDLDDLTVRVSDQLATDLIIQTPPIPERFTVLVECESKDAQDSVLDRLRVQGLNCRAMTT